MKFCNLASGSKGNASIIISDSTTILIDDGISLRELKNRCQKIGIDYTKISAVFITHEHVDHIKGAESLAKALDIPVYVHPQSLFCIKNKIGEFCHAIEYDFVQPITINDITLTAFRVNHDANYTQGFVIQAQDKVLTMATDLGSVNKHIFEKLSKSNYIFLESNYDPTMLMQGSYPYIVKKRIMGTKGHLSNEDCALTIVQLHKEFGKKDFMIAHISQNNNSLDAIMKTFNEIFDKNGLEFSNFNIEIANQDLPSKVIEI